MAISSNTLFHFCRTLDVLKEILSDGFYPSYCWEEVTFHSGRILRSGVPMVSFCDIPLSQVSKHNEVYGNYGIGMSMEWAKSVKLNPVLYINPESKLALSLLTMGDKLFDFIRSNKIHEENKNLEISWDNLYQLTQYFKNYRGDIYERGELKRSNYKYYDEREWRFVVNVDDDNIMVEKAEFDKWRGDVTSSKPLLKDHKVSFNAKDIKYVIVESDSEVENIVNWINTAAQLSGSPHDKQILTTRITTIQQIGEDF